MLYLCVGTDFEKRKKKTDDLTVTMQQKRPDAELLVLDTTSEHIVPQLQQQISGMGLFDNKTITKGLGLCEDKIAKDYVFKNLDQLVSSDNAFVLSETKLTKTEIGKIEKSGATVFVFDNSENPSTHNLFYLGDLLLQKNKSKLWIAVQEELRSGISIEELFGIIMWQTKSLHLSKTTSQSESGLKPFVYNKCIKSPWTQEESRGLHQNLIIIYHQSRRGGIKLEERLEQLILSI